MKRLIPLIVLACIALGTIGVAAFKGDGLPYSFDMVLNADLTSSGGSRTYAATLSVTGNDMTGESRYASISRETVQYECVLTNVAGGVWTNRSRGGECPIPLSIPASRAELAAAIKNGSIVLSGSCGHKQLCYDMTVR